MKSLVIDSCFLADESFALILEGIRLQTPPSAGRLYLKQIVYVNNKMGPKALGVLEKIIPSLAVFQINNVKMPTSSTKALIAQLGTGKRLQKLRLSNINLNDDASIAPLFDLVAS